MNANTLPSLITSVIPPNVTDGDIFIFVTMTVGALVSVALLTDAVLDRRAVSSLPQDDRRRKLANGLLIASFGYFALKIVCFYIAFAILYELPSRGIAVRFGLSGAMILCDVCMALFTWLRKQGLPLRRGYAPHPRV